MKNYHLLIICVIMVFSCTCTSNNSTTISDTSTEFGLQLRHTIDSLMNYVDSIDSHDMSYCTLLVDSIASGEFLKIMIGRDPVYRLYKSTENTSDSDNTFRVYGGVGLRRDSSHIILMDSVTYNILGTQISEMLFVEDIFNETKMKHLTDDMPHIWKFKLLFDANNLSNIREL